MKYRIDPMGTQITNESPALFQRAQHHMEHVIRLLAVGRHNLDFGPLLDSLGEPSKIILLHGDDVNILGLMEICRPYQNVLLDLSFTLCRYEGSSVDLDLRFLFQNFDQRVCVGSDNPNFSLAQFRRRFDELTAGLDQEKGLNAAHRNLQSFIGTS